MTNQKPIYCILAVDKNNGIATSTKRNNSSIPWKFKEDFEYFKRITTNVIDCTKSNAVVMGRKTYEDIPEKNRPLVGRLNVIITSTCITGKNIMCFKSPELAMEYLNNAIEIERIYIIGGVSLYNQYINSPITTGLYLTRVNHDYDADLKVDINLSHYVKVREEIVDCLDLESKPNLTVNTSFERYLNKNNMNNQTELSYITNNKENLEELQYLNILERILKNGHYRPTRNAHTYSLFGAHMEFNLENNTFPLLTTKKCLQKEYLRN